MIMGARDPNRVYAMAAPRDSDYNLIHSDHFLIFKWLAGDGWICPDVPVQTFRVSWGRSQFFYPAFILHNSVK